ncbi:MAG: hypothetical protein U0X91_30690 [Spirosomataceae bacterium]
MKNKQKLLEKANSILLLIKEKEDHYYSTEISISDIISETEILFFAYDRAYPALSDLVEYKQNRDDYSRKGIHLHPKIKVHILRFIDFLNDYE